MLIGLLPAIVALVGLVIFLATKNNGDVKEIGRIMFFCGLLVLLFACRNEVVRLLSSADGSGQVIGQALSWVAKHSIRLV